jgi:hypothetical protein
MDMSHGGDLTLADVPECHGHPFFLPQGSHRLSSLSRDGAMIENVRGIVRHVIRLPIQRQ